MNRVKEGGPYHHHKKKKSRLDVTQEWKREKEHEGKVPRLVWSMDSHGTPGTAEALWKATV